MHHIPTRQITVALENQPGRLAAICELLSANAINIEALSVIDSIEQGVVRMVTSDAVRCRQLLEAEGMYIVEAAVLALELRDEVGKLAIISRELGAAGINIDYLYGSADRMGGPTRLILKVSDSDRAAKILAALPEE